MGTSVANPQSSYSRLRLTAGSILEARQAGPVPKIRAMMSAMATPMPTACMPSSSEKWVVSTKLVNPTYYPPRGGRIRAADDPENPLGERWIGLRGVAGDALGQQRYGIHGTIEPESIGRSQTLGCIRMHNADVAELFTLVVPGETRVTVN